ncbi:MAG TPA: 2-oxo acid dehydrogenase subunit E2 [Gemmatimonadaceae bacterium]|nr:2-oxo acid dehydrogenase subunit E2 [Gemmatimonadaceae bacterium]
MATKVVMEALSPTMEEGRLVTWIKHEGDQITKGEVLAEIETDKAVMELVARGEGVLRKQVLAEGDTAPVGALVGVIAAPDEDIAALIATEGAAGPVAAGGPTPASDRTTTEPPAAVVARTQESAGASAIPQTPAQSQVEASAPPQGKVAGGSAGVVPPRPAPSAPQPSGARANGERLRSSPLARRLASERGLDLGNVQGSGPGGRIIRRDIEAAVQRAPAAATAPAPRIAIEGEFRDVPLTQLRKTIAKRLAESIGPIPTFYLTAEFAFDRVAEMRAAMAAMGDDYKVSYNDIILKAVATALVRHPEVNAHWLGDRIRYFSQVHLGMAVAIEDGLITPVIFDAGHKGLGEIAHESRALAARARERKLAPEEYTGSTFSVSNLGMFGIDQFTAIINPPEAGILAIGAVEDKPVADGGTMRVAKRVRMTMSCDHRVIDGATGARFLQTLRQMLENPLMLVW